jgi:hypothetical protein
MHARLRRRITLLLCLSLGVLLVAYLAGREPNQPSAVPTADKSVAPESTVQSPGEPNDEVTSTPFPLQAVPGSASVTARDEETQSPHFSTLDLGSDAVPAADESLGPPPWARAGTRLTFYSAAASVAQSRFAWVEDPDGTWEDAATGKRYRRTDESGESVGSASGDGFGQIDVLAVDGTDVVLSQSLYAIDRSNNSFIPAVTAGAKVPGAEIAGCWIHPARLAQLQEVRADGLLILRGDYPLNGTTYKAISFAFTTPGAYQQYTYDTQSGVLLSATTSTAGASSPVSGPEGPTQGNTQLTVSFFARVRQRTMPGVDGVNPEWVGRTRRLDYSGTYLWRNPVDPTSGTVTSPMTIGVAVQPGGNEWAAYTAQTTIQALGSSATGSGVTGPTGLYWLSPQALAAVAAMRAGQVLDKDPITGEQVVVQSVGRDAATGRNLVTIASRLPGITTSAGYDTTTGVLAAYAAQIPGSGTTIGLQLQGGP